ncbi:MAG TPA: thiamine-phosphate kinase [Candidatus Omnitrophota bacterium]|nr:thiamine-phosphate kinase [Candidatus Omnitrophota bacterium]
MRIKDIGEIGVIDMIRKGVRLDRSVVKGIGDDAAVIRWTRDKYILFTCDMIIEDVHFKRASASPFEIGWKAMARNISDIAAMGGVPKYALISAGLDPDMSVSYVRHIKRGILSAAGRFGINVVGGDTSKSSKLVIDISLIGEVEKDYLTLRSGARKGDVILVTGAIGGSSKGRHLNFMPRLEEARHIVKNFKVNSMIDVSDGLLMDLSRVLRASYAGARIFKDSVPLSRDADSFEKAVSEGEDFELLFTMSLQEARRFFIHGLGKMKTPVTLIGQITGKEKGFVLVTERGEKKLSGSGFLHF